MKICHFTSVHPYKDTRIFLKECATLAAAGYEVHLVAPDAPEQVLKGIHLHSAATPAGGRFSRMTKTVWAVYQKVRALDADIYHFHDPELLLVGLLLKRKGKKVIYDSHEDVPRDILMKNWIPAYLRALISGAYEVFENFAAKRMSYVIAATPFIQKRFAKITPHCKAVNNYPILDELEYGNPDWDKKKRAVTYVGSITAVRGIAEMVQAIGKTDVKLFLGGKFSPLQLREEIRTLPGWEKVEELGQIDRTEVARIFSISRAGLVLLHPGPNHTDAQPNKLFEYMSAGIPVIGSHFPLWQEIIEGNNCGLCVDPLDPAAIAKAITWLADHPAEAMSMGENGRKAVRENYNWDAEGKTLITIYEGLGVQHVKAK
ncbi:MAG: glycosyltransferase family 4 protein [Desulfosporosinus sp.]|jgi:glycosyltransferase involved in cell wall biosynthesis